MLWLDVPVRFSRTLSTSEVALALIFKLVVDKVDMSITEPSIKAMITRDRLLEPFLEVFNNIPRGQSYI